MNALSPLLSPRNICYITNFVKSFYNKDDWSDSDRHGSAIGHSGINSECPCKVLKQPLLFQTGTRETLDDLALEEEERDQRGQATEHCCCHDLGIVNAVGGLHRRETDRQRHHIRARDGDEWPDEVVPRGNEGENGDRRNRGL